MAKIYGIDVSHYQGTINWKQTASELRRVNGGTSPGFAILRVGYSARHGKGGLWMDNQWTKNVEGCEAYGVPMGVYVYNYLPGSSSHHGPPGREPAARAYLGLPDLSRRGV